jgi:DNA-binding CsgD family transcriptional regulator
MTASPLRKIQPPASAHAGAGNTVAALVQELIQQAALTEASPAHKTAGQPEPEVMLDVEVDGVRCLLVRSRPHPHAHSALSPRELEIARMVATGYPNKIIADVLDISEWTVGTHLRRIFAKLGVGSRAAMVSRLIEEGVLCEYTGRIKST